MENKINIAWFSCGITSAVACKLAIKTLKNVVPVYIKIESAHEDNDRFINDCEKWYGRDILVLSQHKYKDQFQVISKTKYINGPFGARCSLELKKEVRRKFEKENNVNRQVFGFEFEKKEINRAVRFAEQNPHTNPYFPLIEAKKTKAQCADLLLMEGIDLPKMYYLGYPNNNCIGCVKGGKGYWNKIREDFPKVFSKMAGLEREIGATCLKKAGENGSEKLYLDELNPSEGNKLKPVIPNCGMFCQSEMEHIISPEAEAIWSDLKKYSQTTIF